jgi:hypothetical protein
MTKRSSIIRSLCIGILVVGASAVAGAQTPAPAPAPADPAALRAERDSMVQLLRNMVPAQESYFSDHNQYADSVSRIAVTVRKDLKLSMSAAPSSWTATVTSPKLPGVECGVAVGRQNPIKSDAPEGVAVCGK